MVEIKLDQDTLRYITAFENFTGARVKDCFEEEDRVVFVIEDGDLGRAIGKGGVNVVRLRELLKKELEVVGYSADKPQFVKNIFHRYPVDKVAIETRRDGSEIARIHVDARFKGKAIGRGGRNVQLAKLLLQRHSGIVDVVVE